MYIFIYKIYFLFDILSSTQLLAILKKLRNPAIDTKIKITYFPIGLLSFEAARVLNNLVTESSTRLKLGHTVLAAEE